MGELMQRLDAIGANRTDWMPALDAGPAAPLAAETALPSGEPQQAADPILHLAELVPVVRARLEIGAEFPDDAILASLKTIAARAEERERWQAAFASNLGQWLGLNRDDLPSALTLVVSLMPQPAS